MTRERLRNFDAKTVRDLLNETVKRADELHSLEHELIDFLVQVDNDRFFVRFGYKSLNGFCQAGLRFSKTQSQRIVTQVRRKRLAVPMAKIGKKGHAGSI